MYPDTCPLSKCELKKSGCVDPYDGTNLSIGDSDPFSITAKVDNVSKEGYKDTVCVSCSTAE
jgi:hypothetical protein